MPMDINSIAGGALAEKIERELQRVAENVLDPNTKAESTRKVTITISIKPNETRQIGSSNIEVKSSLVATKGIPTSFLFDYTKDGKAAIKELLTSDPNQTIMNNAGEVADSTGKVLPMASGANKFK